MRSSCVSPVCADNLAVGREVANLILQHVPTDVERMVEEAIGILKAKSDGIEGWASSLKLVRGTLIQRGSTTGWEKKR
jgi:hypothetical protein